MKNLVVFLVSAFSVYVAFNLLMYVKQRDLMYLPSLERIAPAEAGLTGVEEVALTTASGVELISWLAQAQENRPTILFFHGNAGAVDHRAHRFHELMAYGYGVFVVGYPGYGGNAGEPSETSFVEASKLAYDHLRNAGVASDDIVIYGESIGSGIAVQLAAQVPARALVLEAPMSSAIDVAREHYPILLASFLMKDSFLSVDYIDRIDMPLLVIHGEQDAIIPIHLSRRLLDRAVEPKTLVVVEGAGHNNLSSYAVDGIASEFIESL